MNKVVLTVNVIWDEDARMFVATSDDIPGLATEADSYEALLARVEAITPELLELNNNVPDVAEIPIAFHQNHYKSIRLH
ncbi:MAG: DUF1902 domain-containing protein [Bdellovibrionales bacterium]